MNQAQQVQRRWDRTHKKLQSTEIAAAMANHASTRTTQLYYRRPDTMTLDEVERIHI